MKPEYCRICGKQVFEGPEFTKYETIVEDTRRGGVGCWHVTTCKSCLGIVERLVANSMPKGSVGVRFRK